LQQITKLNVFWKNIKRVSFVSESEVLVKFYALHGEDPAREIFRRAQISINCEFGEKKTN
jgi:hypothetical protein